MKVIRGTCPFCKQPVYADPTQLITYATYETEEGKKSFPTHKLCRRNIKK